MTSPLRKEVEDEFKSQPGKSFCSHEVSISIKRDEFDKDVAVIFSSLKQAGKIKTVTPGSCGSKEIAHLKYRATDSLLSEEKPKRKGKKLFGSRKQLPARGEQPGTCPTDGGKLRKIVFSKESDLIGSFVCFTCGNVYQDGD